jgi:hypothetical protein
MTSKHLPPVVLLDSYTGLYPFLIPLQFNLRSAAHPALYTVTSRSRKYAH